MNGRFHFLGTGASTGVPIPGCDCDVCRSGEPKNKRLRSGGLFEVNGQHILLDAGPDLRAQALKRDLKRIDGLLITHAHYDHVAGLDELRVYNFRQRTPIPCLLSQDTLSDLKRRYDYLFEEPSGGRNFAAEFDFSLLSGEQGKVDFLGLPFEYITYWQGRMPVNGYRLGNFAFVSDIRTYKEELFDQLRGLRHLVVSALRMSESHVHFSVDEAVAFARRVGATHTWLIHMAHDLDHDQTNAYIPPEIQLSYDGLSVDFTI